MFLSFFHGELIVFGLFKHILPASRLGKLQHVTGDVGDNLILIDDRVRGIAHVRTRR